MTTNETLYTWINSFNDTAHEYRMSGDDFRAIKSRISTLKTKLDESDTLLRESSIAIEAYQNLDEYESSFDDLLSRIEWYLGKEG